MNRLVPACLAVILVGCITPGQSAATGDSTTSSGAPTTATPDPTTTSTVTSVTTTAPVSGDALVVSESFVLGWWADGAWQRDPEYRPLKSGEEFQIISVEDATYSAIGGEPVAACDWVVDDMRQVPLTPGSGGGRIGVSAPWEVKAPYVAFIEADQDLVQIAIDLLAEEGIVDPEPVFAQILELDLDGDDEFEIVAVLDRDSGILGADEDAYGMAFVVRPDGSVQVIGEYELAELEFSNGNESELQRIVSAYRVYALMDINHDGTVELAMSSSSWESWADEIFALDYEASQLTQVLGAGCGA